MRKISILVCSLISFLLVNTSAHAQATLTLIAARDGIEGSFVTSGAVYADAAHVYLGSAQGSVFVLARNRGLNFPVQEVINVGSPVTAIRGNGQNIFVATRDGFLRVYTNQVPLQLMASIQLSEYGLASMSVVENKIYLTKGQGNLTADSNRVYITQRNEGDFALEVDIATLQVTKTYGTNFEPDVTVVYDRLSSIRLGAVPNPLDIRGYIDLPNLTSDEVRLYQNGGGCCGSGIDVYTISPLALSEYVPRLFTNTIAFKNKWMITGTESGSVELLDKIQSPIGLVQSVDLRQLTGHSGQEDIEIRSVWVDGLDNLVFAGSSWGNNQSSSLLLPSFFVLELLDNQVLFATFTTKMALELGPKKVDTFEVKANFTLGAGSDGIDPVHEDVRLDLKGGTSSFSTTISAGSFKKDKKGLCKFEGTINGVELVAKITPLGHNSFAFQAAGAYADLTGIATPVTVTLTIGDDSGSTTVTAKLR